MEQPQRLVKLNKKDIRAIAQLEAECFEQPWSKEQIGNTMKIKNYLFYGIKSDDLLIAYISLQFIPYGDSSELEILNLATSVAYRKMGLGTRLLQCMFKIGKRIGCKTIFLEVREGNKEALSLYTKAGFITFGQRKNYYTTPEGKENALLMQFQFPENVTEIG